MNLILTEKIPQQASNDAQVIEMWLHDKPDNTRKAYLSGIEKFGRYLPDGVPNLRHVTLGLLQGFHVYLKESGLRDKSIQCHMSTVKSLFTFAQRIGYIQFNPAAVIKLRKPKDTLAQRLLDRATVIKMIDSEKNPRNRALMRLLYVSGIRSSEAINLKACDLMKHETGGQITVTAKGGKTLAVWIDQTTWEMIQDCCGEVVDGCSSLNNFREGVCKEGPGTVTTGQEMYNLRQNQQTIHSHPQQCIFRTSTGRPLHLNHVLKIVRAAAKRVGINKPVSPHWLRHATATHLMDAGVSLVAIKEHLGHETIQTTTRYTHVKPSAANAKLLAW